MRSNNSGCLTAFVSGFSRIMLLMVWIARPVMMDATFSSFIIPCLGFMFLPFTTLMYVFLMQGVGTIQGLDWLWLFLAALMDIASIGAAGAANRNRIPAGYPGSYPPDRRRRSSRRRFTRLCRAGRCNPPRSSQPAIIAAEFRSSVPG